MPSSFLVGSVDDYPFSFIFSSLFSASFDINCMGVRLSEEIIPGIHARYLGFPDACQGPKPSLP